MANEYYNPSGYPATRAPGASSPMRAELNALGAAFDKMPILAGNAGKIIVVNPTNDGLIAVDSLSLPNDLSVAGDVTVGGRLVAKSGAAASGAPAHGLTFDGSPDTGVFNPIGVRLQLAVDGVQVALWDGSSATLAGPVVIDANSAGAALRVTQVGAGDIVRFEDEANPDASPFVINASGVVQIGNQSSGGLVFEAGPGGRFDHRPSTTGQLDINSMPLDGTSLAQIRLFRNTNTTGRARFAILRGDNSTTSDHLFETGVGTLSLAQLSLGGGVGSVGGSSNASVSWLVNAAPAGTTAPRAIQTNGNIPSSATSNYIAYSSSVGTQAASFTLPTLTHFQANQLTVGAGSSVTDQYGFRAQSNLVGASNNYGFWGGLPAGGGNWNFYGAGTAPSFLAGTLFLGNPGNIDFASFSPSLQNSGSSTSASSAGFANYANNTATPIIFLAKSRNASLGGHTVVQNGDSLGNFRWLGSDGDEFVLAAEIRGVVDGAPGNNDMPGRIEFRTTPDGSNSPALRWQVDSVGRLRADASAGGSLVQAVQTPAYAASLSLNGALGNLIQVGTLTGNVTSLSISNQVEGTFLSIRFKQDATGGRTVAVPSGAKVSGSVGTAANQVSYLNITYNSTDARWEGSWLVVPV